MLLAFPGQGSQQNYMLSSANLLELAKSRDFHEHIDFMGDSLKTNIIDLIESENDLINNTKFTQPLLLFCSYLHYVRFIEQNPNLTNFKFTGHSLGEYTALVCNESLKLIDGIKIVIERAQLMSSAPNGAMSAVLGLNEKIIEDVCNDLTDGMTGSVGIGNYNTPLQSVISGNIEEVTEAEVRLKNAGAKKTIRLNVSVASHSQLMKKASYKFKEFMSKFEFITPKSSIIQNVDASEEKDIDLIKSKLVKQLYMPVRWSKIMSLHNNDQLFIEIGPGSVLAGLAKGNKINNIHSTSKNGFKLSMTK